MTLLLTIINNLVNEDYENKLYNILNHKDVSEKQKIEFALHCAKDLEKYYDIKEYPDIYKTRQKCLDLIAQCLMDEKSVSNKRLTEAVNAATYAANATNAANVTNAAYAAVYAAYAAANATNAAYVAYAAANATYAAAYAAYAAAYAANAAAYVTRNEREKNQKKNFNFLLEILDMNYKFIKVFVS